MKTAYDPFNRDEERQLEDYAAARAEHEAWSLEQSCLGRSAIQRENVGVWISRAPLPIEQPALPPRS